MSSITKPNKELMLSIGESDEEVRVFPFQHISFVGMTGSGKSKLMLIMLCELVLKGISFTLIDGAHDLYRDLSAWIWANWDRIPPFICHRIYTFKVSTNRNVSLNLLNPRGRTGSKYVAWLRARVRKLARDIIRGGGEWSFNEMKRLQRYLTATLYVCAVEVDGKRLGIHKALDVLDLEREDWALDFARMIPFLPARVVRTFLQLQKLSYSKRFDELSSTINRLESFLSELVVSMLESDRPALDIFSIVQSGGIILADMSVEDELAREETVICAGLLMTEVADAKQVGSHATPHILAVDEYGFFAGKDTGDWLLSARHWNLHCWMGFQGSANLVVG